MLANNEECEWSNFISEPLNISQSTLSMKLDSLIKNNYVEKVSKKVRDRKRNVYSITPDEETDLFYYLR